MRQVADIIYICTAVGETEGGVFEIIHWNPHTGGRTAKTPFEELEVAA
jgi:hypothetical protein